MSWINDTLRIRNKDIPIRIGFLKHLDLRFYPENPRIYAAIRSNSESFNQEDIQNQLLEMEHVRALIQDIKKNGGLIDPIIVRDETHEVLEGNSRLAAYRYLASKEDPVKWGQIKCFVLPSDINESDVFSLLGQYHITGKKDWTPYEQAGFLYRRNKHQNIALTELAQDLGISSKKASQLISTYQFMIDVEDKDTAHWSYYEVYLNSNKIKKMRHEHSSLDDVVVQQIKTAQIEKAVDIRDKLPLLGSGSKKVLRKYLSEEIDLYDAYSRVEQSGSLDDIYQKLKRFRSWIVDSDILESILQSTNPSRDKIKFEIGKIKTQCNTLSRKLEKDT